MKISGNEFSNSIKWSGKQLRGPGWKSHLKERWTFFCFIESIFVWTFRFENSLHSSVSFSFIFESRFVWTFRFEHSLQSSVSFSFLFEFRFLSDQICVQGKVVFSLSKCLIESIVIGKMHHQLAALLQYHLFFSFSAILLFSYFLFARIYAYLLL